MGMTTELELPENNSSSDDEELSRKSDILENDKINDLFEKLNQKNDELFKVVTEVEVLKTELNQLRNELSLSNLKNDQLQKSFNLFQELAISLA